MKAYRGCDGDERSSLIFAHSMKEAKKLFWQGREKGTVRYFNVRITLLYDPDYHMSLMIGDKPYLEDNPPCCKSCNKWRVLRDGVCESCTREADG